MIIYKYIYIHIHIYIYIYVALYNYNERDSAVILQDWPSEKLGIGLIFIPKATQAASAAQAEQDRLKELLQEVQYVALRRSC